MFESGKSWTKGCIGDVCQVGDGAHASLKRQLNGIPYLTSKNLKQGQLDLSKVDFISEADFQKHFRSDSKALTLPRENDIILGIIGSIGEPYLMKPRDRFGISSSIAILRPNTDVVLSYYLDYWIRSQTFQDALYGIKGGVAQGYVSLEMIRSLPFHYPPLPTQRKIAGVLSAYDDLIENNTRRIKILEEMAQAIYREWFVNFRFPGHEKVKLVESELGMIPEGWEVKKLEDLYDTGSGGTPSRKHPEYYGGNIDWIKTQELLDCFIFQSEEKINENGLLKSSAKIFPKYTVLMAMYGATIGKLGILTCNAATNQACCAIIPKIEDYNHIFIYLSLLHNRYEILKLRHGAAQQNVSQQVIKSLSIIVPDCLIVNQFNHIQQPIFEQIKNLSKKVIILRQTRDMLLPKLISGEVDVSYMD